MPSPPKRNLSVSISEIFDMPVKPEEEVNPKFLGMLPPMLTELNLSYNRKTVDGTTCSPPLDPVWLDSMTEGLAYMISTAANAPDQVPMLLQLVCTRLAIRLKAYAQAKFPGYVEAMSAELYRVMTSPVQTDSKREAYLQCFNLRLQGHKSPCRVCEKRKECKFKGAFEVPKEK